MEESGNISQGQTASNKTIASKITFYAEKRDGMKTFVFVVQLEQQHQTMGVRATFAPHSGRIRSLAFYSSNCTVSLHVTVSYFLVFPS